MRKITQCISIICAVMTFTFTANAQMTSDPSTHFITTWKVDDPLDLSITIPTRSDPAYDYYYDVNWGDGTLPQTGFTGDAPHTYTAPGIYDVIISGTFPSIYFEGSSPINADKIKKIVQWGSNDWGPSMEGAFSGCTNLVSEAPDTPDFSNVNNMYGMFAYAEAFNGDLHINDWDVSSVTTMYGMFGDASSFNTYIGDWNVENVTNMKLMFAHAFAFNQDIGGWNVGSVRNMESMFRVATNFDQDLGLWNVSNVINMNFMFKDVKLSTPNYDALLMGWRGQPRQPNVIFDGGESQYCAGEGDKYIMTHANPKWTITDGLLDPSCPTDLDAFITIWEVEVPDLSITIPTLNSQTYNYTVAWGDGQFSAELGNATHTYLAPGTYEVKINGVFPSIYFNNGGDRLKIKSIKQWGTNEWGSSMAGAFAGCADLVSNATDTPDFSSVINMRAMFSNATAFNGDTNINNWDVSNVTNMKLMFNHAPSFNQDIGSWVVSGVTKMDSMFRQATAFDQNIGLWNVGQVDNMAFMFRYAESFNQNIGSWNVESVKKMNSMFSHAVSFDQDLGNWDVGEVITMAYMFDGANLSRENYDLLLSGWGALSPIQMNVPFDAGNAKYCTGEPGRDNLAAAGWIITNDVHDCTPPLPLVGGRLDVNDNEQLSATTLYPNPMRNQLTLANFENVQLESVSIYDLTGRLIKTVDLKGMASEMVMDVSSLSKATYMVLITGENGSQVSKLMIKE